MSLGYLKERHSVTIGLKHCVRERRFGDDLSQTTLSPKTILANIFKRMHEIFPINFSKVQEFKELDDLESFLQCLE